MNKQTKKILTHVWDVGQNATIAFMPEYLKNNNFTKKMKRFKSSKYGGYIIWG